MGYIVEISESKVEMLSEHAGKALKHIGKAMECIDDLRHTGGHMGYRHDDDGYDRMGERGYGRYGMRDEDMRPEDYDRMGERYPRERWEEWPPYMGERRGRSATTGRYVRR